MRILKKVAIERKSTGNRNCSNLPLRDGQNTVELSGSVNKLHRIVSNVLQFIPVAGLESPVNEAYETEKRKSRPFRGRSPESIRDEHFEDEYNEVNGFYRQTLINSADIGS